MGLHVTSQRADAVSGAWFPGAGFDLVVLVASLGGPPVLRDVIGGLPSDFPAAVLVVQHFAAHRPWLLRDGLAAGCRLSVERPQQDGRIRARTLYVAQPGDDVAVTADGRWAMTQVTARRPLFCPSGDAALASAARALGPRALGVVLTGRLSDGAAGAGAVRMAGGVVIAQEPASCRAPDMPNAAIARGVDFILPPEAIAPALVTLVMVPGSPAWFGLPRPIGHG